MFIRWKHRASTGTLDRVERWRRQAEQRHIGRLGNPGSTTHYAYLVENTRIAGKPRQRVLLYLGCIADHNAHNSRTTHHLGNLSARYWFWRDAQGKLDTVSMDADTRRRCEAALAAVVPLLSEAETAAIDARLAAFRAADIPLT